MDVAVVSRLSDPELTRSAIAEWKSLFTGTKYSSEKRNKHLND